MCLAESQLTFTQGDTSDKTGTFCRARILNKGGGMQPKAACLSRVPAEPGCPRVPIASYLKLKTDGSEILQEVTYDRHGISIIFDSAGDQFCFSSHYPLRSQVSLFARC